MSESAVERAGYIAARQPGLRGFTRPNLFRMPQFYETYCDEDIVAPLVRQLPWSHNPGLTQVRCGAWRRPR